MNQKIETKLGVIIIVIFALTTLAFALVWEKSRNENEVENNATATNKPAEQGGDEKKQTDENKDIYYKSNNFGVEFTYKSFRTGKLGSFIQENDNKIRLMVARNDGGYTNERCKQDKDCQEIGGLMYWPGTGALEIYEKNADESIEDAIMKVVKNKGGDPSKCEADSYVEHYVGREEKQYYIKYKKEYIPMENENVSNGFERRKEFEKEAINACSDFAVGVGPGGKNFIYHSEESKTKFAYIYGDRSDAPDINDGSIKFIGENRK